MKKFLVSLIVLMSINILISVYFNGFRIFNVLPPIFLIIMTVYSVNVTKDEAMIGGAMIGFMVDIFFGDLVGYNALLYLWFAFALNRISKNFLSNEPVIVLLMTLGAIFIYDIFNFAIFSMFQGKTYFWSYMFHIVVMEMIYAVIVYFPLSSLTIKYKNYLKSM